MPATREATDHISTCETSETIFAKVQHDAGQRKAIAGNLLDAGGARGNPGHAK